MRSTPDLQVLIGPGSPVPGSTFVAEATFDSVSETPIDEITFDLKGYERIMVRRGKSSLVRSQPLIHLVSRHPATTFTPGKHVYRAKFELPSNLPPFYWGKCGWVDYTLEVRADVPWWPDAKEKYEIRITPAPFETKITPYVAVSDAVGASANRLYAEIALASSVVEAGGAFEGTVAFTNLRSVRGARVSLVAYEHLHSEGDFWNGGNINEVAEGRRWSVGPVDPRVPDGAPVPFRFPIPQGTIPSFEAALTSLRWFIQVEEEELFRWNPILVAPVTVAPASGRPQLAASVPAVGRARLADQFRHVAGQLGFTVDESGFGGMRGSVGVVAVRIGLETRPDGAPCTAAHLEVPSLGMGLRLGPAAWTDTFSRKEIEIGDKAFDDRFHVESRFPEQARALFSEALRRQLLAFEDAEGSDEGLWLAMNEILTGPGQLARFAEAARAAAGLLSEAVLRLPVPPPFAPHEGAWRAFAETVGGRFEAGRGAVLDGAFSLEPFELVTVWDDRGAAEKTTVNVPLGAPIDPSAVSPAARAHAASIESSAGAKLTISEQAITLDLPKIVADPADLTPTLEGLVRLVHLVRGRGNAGPFRS